MFLVGWTGLLIATYAWITQRYALVLLGLFPPAILELINGNIHLLLAAAVALGFRYPWTWSFVLLTKVTPGIGLVWFAVRREWRPWPSRWARRRPSRRCRSLFAPWMWREWIELLIAESGKPASGKAIPIPLTVRLPVALLVVVWGARTDRPWTVAVAAFLAVPAMWWYSSVMLLGIIAIRRTPADRTQAPVRGLPTASDHTGTVPFPPDLIAHPYQAGRPGCRCYGAPAWSSRSPSSSWRWAPGSSPARCSWNPPTPIRSTT